MKMQRVVMEHLQPGMVYKLYETDEPGDACRCVRITLRGNTNPPQVKEQYQTLNGDGTWGPHIGWDHQDARREVFVIGMAWQGLEDAILS